MRLRYSAEEGKEHLHSYAEQLRETCGWREAVRLEFHTQFVFPTMAGAVKLRRDVRFLQRMEYGGRAFRWGLSFARMRNH